MPKKSSSIEIKNRRASFDYTFLETYVAGIVLAGTEIKSVRTGKASLVDAFCYFDMKGQLWVKGMNIAQYFWGSWGQHEPARDRKLLLSKHDLRHLRRLHLNPVDPPCLALEFSIRFPVPPLHLHPAPFRKMQPKYPYLHNDVLLYIF